VRRKGGGEKIARQKGGKHENEGGGVQRKKTGLEKGKIECSNLWYAVGTERVFERRERTKKTCREKKPSFLEN